MQKIFYKIVALLNKVTGKKFLHITPNEHNCLGKSAAWSDLGFWYVGNVYDSSDIAYGIAQNGVVEKEDTDLVVSILEKLNSPVVYDVGANTGYYGILAATKFNATVHSFEPIPDHISCIKESSRINGVEDKVTTHAIALGNTSEKLELKLAGSGSTLTENFLGKTSVPTLMVSVETLDSLNLPAPHFIKIDVEGYEWEVLQGARETIAKNRPTCFVEIAQSFPERKFVHPQFSGIIKFFEEQDYKIERSTSLGLVGLEDIPPGVSMYLFTPN